MSEKEYININNYNDVIEKLKDNDYLYISTNKEIEEDLKKESIVCLKLDDNKYFCSDKYCLFNDKLCKFNKFFKGLNCVLICDNFIIKYNSKKYELEKEIKILKELDVDCKLIDAYNSKYYIMISINRIKAKNLNCRLPLLNTNQKFFVLFSVLYKLKYLESFGYTYNDLSTNNVLYSENENIYLIDYGSLSKNKKLYECRNSYSTLSIINYFINFVFTIFSSKKKVYYKIFYIFYDILNKTNYYTYEEKNFIKDLIIFLQKDLENLKYSDIYKYLTNNYKNYYIFYLNKTKEQYEKLYRKYLRIFKN